MSIGMPVDNWTFGSAAWSWDVIVDELSVDDLYELSRGSFLDVVTDSVGDALDAMLPGHADELVEMVSSWQGDGTNDSSTGDESSSSQESSTQDGVAALVNKDNSTPVSSLLGLGAAPLQPKPTAPSAPVAKTVKGLPPKTAYSPTVRLTNSWHLQPSCWFQLQGSALRRPNLAEDDHAAQAREKALRNKVPLVAVAKVQTDGTPLHSSPNPAADE